ncbi:hypothetical protein AAKU55_005101 [Oxalobacteraceae bacterium GrIS 1.11]
MPKIHIENYPQLRSIAWNRPGAVTIDAEDAFALYEANWRYVDQETLTAQEAHLIQQLKQEIGHGVMYV